ncbi:hypothetical protein ACTXT7_007073 [Hymenolepis weldensis]
MLEENHRRIIGESEPTSWRALDWLARIHDDICVFSCHCRLDTATATSKQRLDLTYFKLYRNFSVSSSTVSSEMAKVAKQGGLSDLNGNAEELRKSLPHVDLETGLKNRVVKRDPISGLGDLPKEHCEFGRPKTAHQNRKVHVILKCVIEIINKLYIIFGSPAFNKTLLTWDADTATPLPKPNKNSANCEDSILARNPIALTGNLGDEVDALRCTSRPRKPSSRGPQRDPIAGRGDFGEREWDPIWKYNGRVRRARSSTGIRCNPLTGENAKTFDISTEEKRRCSLTPKTPRECKGLIEVAKRLALINKYICHLRGHGFIAPPCTFSDVDN